MARYKDIVDLYFTNEGDFYFDEDRNDLEDTSNHLYRGFLQRLLTRVQSKPGDWPTQREVGIGLEEFIGKPNNRQTAAEIQTAFYNAVIRGDLIIPSDMNMEIFPTSPTSIVVILMVQPATGSQSLFVSFTYDMKDNKLIPRNI